LAAQHTLRYHHTVVWSITLDGTYAPDPLDDPDQLVFPAVQSLLEKENVT